MSSRHVEEASEQLAAAVRTSVHKGWSTFDERLEGARFHLLHEIVSKPVFDAVEAGRLVSELEQLAHSYGYGVADSYLCSASGLDEEQISDNPELLSARENLYEEEGENDQYFMEVRASCRLLREAAASAEAREYLEENSIQDRMAESFRLGRDVRTSQEFPASSAAP